MAWDGGSSSIFSMALRLSESVRLLRLE